MIVNFKGFLSTGTDEAVGNWAMRDTLAVLKWVRHNIEYFGGDENSVTIFGQSAGAASVHYIVLSNLFNGKMKKFKKILYTLNMCLL